MFASKFSSLLQPTRCSFKSVRGTRVMVVGGTSELGQAVSLLLRGEPGVTSLAVQDASPRVHDIVADLLHVPAESRVVGVTDQEELRQALFETDIVLVTDAVTGPTGTGRANQIPKNVNFIQMISQYIARCNPMPLVGIATEPIGTLVPMAAEIMRRHGTYEARKLFGLTGADALRAQALYAALHGLGARECSVPVICGHSPKTAVPLLSQAMPHRPMTMKAARNFTEKFRQSGREIQKEGFSPGLGSAFSVFLFTKAILQAFEMKSYPCVDAFVENNDFGTNFFAGRVNVTPDGVGDMHRYANISQYECDLLQKSIQDLRSELFEGKKLLNTVVETVT